MSKSDDGTDSMFCSNVPLLNKAIVDTFLEINNLRRKDMVILFSKMVLKRSWADSLRTGGGPPGFAEIDDNYIAYMEEEVRKGRADQELVARYKGMSFIERHKYTLKPVTRAMLTKIAEDIESGKYRKNGDGKEAAEEK